MRAEIPDSAIIKKTGNTVVYRLADGSIVSGMGFPDWGVAAVLTVLECGPRGEWTRIAQRATKDEAGDTPGMEVVDEFRHERGASRDTIINSCICANWAMCGNDAPKSFVRLLRAADQDGEFRYIPPRNGLMGLLFATAFGDTLHTVPPFFLVSQSGEHMKQIELGDRNAVDACPDSQSLLIADQYGGDNPIVIDLKTGRAVFSSENATDAVWIP